MTSIIELEGIGKRFVKPVDLAGRVSRLFGARAAPEIVRAVDSVDLIIGEGQVTGLVGESGCGKSTLGRMVAGILSPTAGAIRYRGRDIASFSRSERRDFTLAVQMIFQDPMTSLNPRMRVGDIVGEAPVYHGLVPARQQRDYVVDMLRLVGLNPDAVDRYPHQFSGGQRARVGIARALAVKPRVLVCDEAVASLDVSIQAQVLNLFERLRRELDLTLLFVSHDLGVIHHISDRVAVMYLGRIAEFGAADQIFASPQHPYTKLLLSNLPDINKRHHRFRRLYGEVPSPLNPPTGCYFHPRCPEVLVRCRTEQPRIVDRHSRLVACWRAVEEQAAPHSEPS